MSKLRHYLTHETTRLVNLDETHVTWTRRCGVAYTGRIEDEYNDWVRKSGTVESAYLSHLA